MTTSKGRPFIITGVTLAATVLACFAMFCIVNGAFVAGLLYYSTAGLAVAILSPAYQSDTKLLFLGVLFAAWLLYITSLPLAFPVVAALIVIGFCVSCAAKSFSSLVIDKESLPVEESVEEPSK